MVMQQHKFLSQVFERNLNSSLQCIYPITAQIRAVGLSRSSTTAVSKRFGTKAAEKQVSLSSSQYLVTV